MLASVTLSARADVYVLSKNAAYTNNEIISTGLNKPFPMEQFQQSLKAGKRLISVAYTRLSGWVLSMVDGTGIRLQHISMTPDWPAEWIDSEISSGYMVSAVAHGQGQWCVITSLNCGLSDQVYQTGDWESLRPFIREEWNGSDRRISAMCSDGGANWAIVMSFSDTNTGQRYDFKNNWTRMAPIVEQYFANDYYISCISYGARNVGVVFNLGDGTDTPRQICITDPQSLDENIAQGYIVTHIANGL